MADDSYTPDEDNIEEEEVDQTVSNYQLYHKPLSEIKIRISDPVGHLELSSRQGCRALCN